MRAVAIDLSVASNSEEAAPRPTDESEDVPCQDDIERRGPVELARDCQVEEALLAVLGQHLPSSGLVADRYGLNITLEKLRCLEDATWLNSEVISFWLEWWCERIGAGTEHRAPQSTNGPKCWIASTYFYSRLTENGTYSFDSVRRWTSHLDVFALDKVIIPINQGNVHWFLAVVDIRRRQTQVFDSMGVDRPAVHDTLQRWVSDVWRGRGRPGSTLPVWTRLPHNMSATPRQLNTVDCGVFMCLFAAYASLDSPFSFDQRHISWTRRWMAQTIYKVGEAAGQVPAGLCSGESAEPGGKDGGGNRDDAKNTCADPHLPCHQRDALLRGQLSRFFSVRALKQADKLEVCLGHGAGPARQQPFTRTLRNIGNTCFFNSVLQVLASIPQFVTEIAAQSLPPNNEDSSFCIAFLKLFVPAIAQGSSEPGVVLDVTSVCDSEWRMGPDDWVDFVSRLTAKHAAGYRIGDYADPSDLLEHLLSIVPAVERMFAIDLRSTIRFPCACGMVPVRENTVRDLGFTVVVNSTDPLVHHILNALAPDTVSYKCDMCHLQSSDERPANK